MIFQCGLEPVLIQRILLVFQAVLEKLSCYLNYKSISFLNVGYKRDYELLPDMKMFSPEKLV